MRNGVILNNRILDIVFISMLTAQLIKVFAPLLYSKKPNFYKIFETGGMPSSHSSSVVSLMVCIAISYGMNNIYFAIATVFSIVVLYDSTGIRREAGKHAKILNDLILNSEIKLFKTKEYKEFKEFLGHTPLEVLAGIILGIIIPLIFRGYLL